MAKWHRIGALSVVLFSMTVAASTVWDDAKHDAYHYAGKIVSIAEDGQEMIVRISGSDGKQTFKVCSSFPGGDALNLSENERVRSLRDAFNHGNPVDVSYNSPFDRCLNFVEVHKEDVSPNQMANVHLPFKSKSAQKHL